MPHRCCCTPPSCSDCFIPFVNEAHTKTRYPRRAIVAISGIGYSPVIFLTAPDCGFCGCFDRTTICDFAGKFFNTKWSWGYPMDRPADGPFSFAGGGSGECTRSPLDPIDFCPIQRPEFITEPYGDCIDHTDGINVDNPGLFDSVPSNPIQIWAYIDASGGSNYLYVLQSWKDESEGVHASTLAKSLLPDYFSLTNDCGTADAMVLPTSLVLGPGNAGGSNHLGGSDPGDECDFEGLTGSVTFTDWVERDFPTP